MVTALVEKNFQLHVVTVRLELSRPSSYQEIITEFNKLVRSSEGWTAFPVSVVAGILVNRSTNSKPVATLSDQEELLSCLNVQDLSQNKDSIQSIKS